MSLLDSKRSPEAARKSFACFKGVSTMRFLEAFPLSPSYRAAAGLLVLLSLFALSFASPLLAHEGEVHEEPEIAPAPLPGEGLGTIYNQSEQFELVVKHPPLILQTGIPLTLFLSEYATNAPVAGARISLEVSGPGGQRPVIAQPTRSPGIYRAQVTFPAEGANELLVSIAAAGKEDLLPIGGLQVKKAGEGTAEKKGQGVEKMVLWVLGSSLLAGLLLLSLWITLRKGGRAADPAGKALLLLLAVGALLWAQGISWAHEGESHGEEELVQPAPASPLPLSPIHLSKESQFLLDIRTLPAQMRELSQRISAPGKVIPKPELEAEVFPPQPGRVVAMGGRPVPRIGDRVRKGQLLVVIEQVLSAPERIQLAAERVRFDAEVRQAQERLAQAARDMERARSLRRVIAEKEIQRIETEYQVAREELKRLEQSKALYDGAEGGTAQGLKRFSLRAPISGVITEAHLTLGEQVETSRQLFKIVDPSVVWIEARVFEGQIPRIRAAREAQVTSTIYPQETFQGRLASLGQVIDESTRTVRTLFEASNSQGKLLIGMFVTLSIGTGRPEKAVVVPAGAILERGGKRMVYVHTRPEEFVPREVAVGTKEGDWVALERGVAVGERVVTEGVYQLESVAAKSSPGSTGARGGKQRFSP